MVKTGKALMISEDEMSFEEKRWGAKLLFREAFLKAQRAFKEVKKSGENPHFRSSYSKPSDVWEACSEALHSNGFSVHQVVDLRDSHSVLCTKLCHVGGHEEESYYLVQAKDERNPQSVGSAVTYARRYSLMSILGLVSDGDDDDGGRASGGSSSGVSSGRPTSIDEAKAIEMPFGRTKGRLLGDLSAKELHWIAHEYKGTHMAKKGAQMLLSLGSASEPDVISSDDEEIPF